MVLESPLWPFIGISLIITAYASFRISQFLYLYFLRSTSVSRYQHRPDVWALVTGASDGIGYAFAEELSRRGFNIILHGRNPQKLDNVKANLNRLFPIIKIRIFIADLTEDSIAPITKLAAEINDFPLTVLINNVGGTKGFVLTDFKAFESTSPQEIDALCKANDRFPTVLTNALLPILSRYQPSLIMNVGSTSCAGVPYLSVYTATKAYIATWSFALSTELAAEGQDIEVLGILSGSTQSGQNGTPPSLFHPSSKGLVHAALQKLGSGKAVVTAYWHHAVQKAFLDSLPEWVLRSTLTSVLKPLKNKSMSRNGELLVSEG